MRITYTYLLLKNHIWAGSLKIDVHNIQCSLILIIIKEPDRLFSPIFLILFFSFSIFNLRVLENEKRKGNQSRYGDLLLPELVFIQDTFIYQVLNPV